VTEAAGHKVKFIPTFLLTTPRRPHLRGQRGCNYQKLSHVIIQYGLRDRIVHIKLLFMVREHNYC